MRKINEGYIDVGIDYVKNNKPKLESFINYDDKKVVGSFVYLHIKNSQEVIDLYELLGKVIAFDASDGTEVGNCSYIYVNGDLKGTIDVRMDMRRKKIGSEMYKFIEEVSGGILTPDKPHTDNARDFWSQKNRDFGIVRELVRRTLRESFNERNGLPFLNWLSMKLGKKIGNSLGSGVEGHVFDLGNAVIRISRRNNLDQASILNKNIPSTVRVYSSGKIKVPQKFLIRELGDKFLKFSGGIISIPDSGIINYMIMEKVYSGRDIEEDIEDVIIALDSYVESLGLNFISGNISKLRLLFEKVDDEGFINEFVKYLRDDYAQNYKIYNEHLETLSELIVVFKNVGKHFNWMDIHPGQFGRNSKGELVAFDLDNSKESTNTFTKHMVSEMSSKPGKKLDKCVKKEIPDYIYNFVSKYSSDEKLLRAGGLPNKMLYKWAFGFTDKYNKIDSSKLKIRWHDDLENVKWEFDNKEWNKSGEAHTIENWAKNIDLSEPIDVDFWENKEDGYDRGFYIQDGHHRYYAASVLGKKLNMNLTITINPIKELSALGYDEFHRCLFKMIKNG